MTISARCSKNLKNSVACGLLGCEKGKTDHSSWKLLLSTGGVYPCDLEYSLTCHLPRVPHSWVPKGGTLRHIILGSPML